MKYPVLIIFAYLLGSIPFGLIIAKAHNKDLRSIGSGNIGATNLARVLGKNWAYLCFALDASKGLLPMLLTAVFISDTPGISEFFLWLAVGCAAIFGHIFPIYANFKGGKGVATSFGVAIGLWPYYTICSLLAFAVWLVVFFKWRYISLASILASIAFPLMLILAITIRPDWNYVNLWPLLVIAVAIPLAVILRHLENIKRLFGGTESKFLKTKTPATQKP